MKKLLCGLMALVMLLTCGVFALAENLDDLNGDFAQYMDPNEQEDGVSVLDEHYGEAYNPVEITMEVSQPAAQNATVSGSGGRVRWTYPVSLSTLQSPYLVLVNKDNLLDESYKPQVQMNMSKVKRTSSTKRYMEEVAGLALTEMFNAARAVTEYTYSITESDGTQVFKTAKFENGMTLYLESAYRSYGTQATSYYNRLKRNGGVDDGYVAQPGASEHQTGLCADILDITYRDQSMNEGFAKTPEAQWMLENCASFGFILRYPKEKEKETGIKYEPWHFRYVGLEAAQYMMQNGLCLEEFTVEYQAAIEDFVNRGGNIEQQMKMEDLNMNLPPESTILEIYDEMGDPEISLIF
ncbi:MAG: M15 family metallopeptidase [Clostridia bacterium]|nr:M15 family metallopeptidase [Clostridia bacterium]